MNTSFYEVVHKGQVVGSYHLFVDAWLHAKHECQYWTKIIGPDGTWVVIPFQNKSINDTVLRMVQLGEFLTEAQLLRAQRLMPNREAIRDQIIVPNLADINIKLGQENDSDYLSYLVLYALQVRSKS